MEPKEEVPKWPYILVTELTESLTFHIATLIQYQQQQQQAWLQQENTYNNRVVLL